MKKAKTEGPSLVELYKDWLPYSTTPWIITDGGAQGEILSREEWKQAKADADLFYMRASNEFIEEVNAARRQDAEDEMYRSMEMHRTPKGKPVPKPGFIYLIESEEGSYKIGRAKDMDSRFRGITLCLPFKVTLRHSFPSADYIAREAELHRRFADKRLEGEWFRLEPADVEAFCTLTS